ncbi:hypothetical protein B0A54_07149 [Friedmanniomyces endolithicus]|uniref:Pro-apoptotic serine protease NMA111 n=1 Tax=Friedmanniomyces endolithicus TaxID=329885 RepID=A0A4U0V3E6_9PEZI|nr:hypothetical protein B0A54_07149 [Friedmanniomyces endolithicus]
MRKECLDVFYGKNNFLLDLRGWMDCSYPEKWTPLMIFERWIDAIGNENAGRLRSLNFMGHSFSVHIRVSKQAPQLASKFHTMPSYEDWIEVAPPGYTFELAACRAEQGLRTTLDNIATERAGKPLRVDDINKNKLTDPNGQIPRFIRDRLSQPANDHSHALVNAVSSTLVFAQQEAGTAVCVSSSGLLLTCSHCVAESEDVLDLAKFQRLLFADGRVVKATCVGYDGKRDLALLQIVAAQSPPLSDLTTADETETSAFPAIALAETLPRRNTPLFCIGHPGSEDFEVDRPGVATGYDVLHISEGRHRGLAVGQDVHDNSGIGALKHDCWTYWGHSGAPLINEQGLLVGLHSSWDDSTGMRRGVAWEAVKAFLDEHAAKIAS